MKAPARLGVAALAVALVAVCRVSPDPGAALTAALAASAAHDSLDDLGAVGDPGVAGIRDAFRAATVAALDRALEAHRTAPRQSATAHRASLYAGELADRFGLALASAIEARDTLEAAETDAHTAAEDLRVARGAHGTGFVLEAARRERAAAESAYNTARAEWKDADAARSAAFDAWMARREVLSVLEDAQDTASAKHEAHLSAIRARRAARLLVGAAELAVEDAEREHRLRFHGRDPAIPDLEVRASQEAELVAVLREAAVAKIEAAEDLRRQAIAAYRDAAEAWRALTN